VNVRDKRTSVRTVTGVARANRPQATPWAEKDELAQTKTVDEDCRQPE